jgi:hypothetical protein
MRTPEIGEAGYNILREGENEEMSWNGITIYLVTS